MENKSRKIKEEDMGYIIIDEKRYKCVNPICDLLEMVSRERDDLKQETENWKESAAMFSRNEDYYRGLLDDVAKHLGKDVFISDDGTVQDTPLRAKIPELVSRLVRL